MSPSSIRYGSHHAQTADLWLPDADSSLPVVALIHGGFWRQLYTKRLMHDLARAIVQQGWAVYNIEYRRVGTFGSGGWPETFDDVSAALDALAGVAGLDTGYVVTCGHSAGGHLALWLAGQRETEVTGTSSGHTVRPCAAVSLAGVVDLVSAVGMGVGAGAVEGLMGGAPSEHPDRYALGSPAALLPLGIPQVLVHGIRDTTVPASLSQTYAAQARECGDDARYVAVDADHMDMIRPQGPAFDAITECLTRFGP
jgi:acetyl esterase/lipase